MDLFRLLDMKIYNNLRIKTIKYGVIIHVKSTYLFLWENTGLNLF